MANGKMRKRMARLSDVLFGKLRSKRRFKDILFRSLFGNNRQALLELYNLLNDTDYSDVEKLEIMTIESALFVTYENDAAFMVSGVINLYEHQSTVNPNMPVRLLIYLAEEYQRIIESSNRSIYGSALISLPTPKCVVFYNGETDIPDVQELLLSDAFENREVDPDLQLKVTVININYGHNQKLMEGCRTLEEYAHFVDIVREHATLYDTETAIKLAMDYCIEHDILAEFLRKNKAEVLGMIFRSFDKKKYEYSLKEEGREEGLLEGREEGLLEGRSNVLIALIKDGEITIESAARRMDMTPEEFEEKYLKEH